LAVALTESEPAVVIAVGSTLAVKAEQALELAPGLVATAQITVEIGQFDIGYLPVVEQASMAEP
jgi:hypothetical protein